MEMVEILKGRLPDGLEIVKVKNRTGRSQVEILFRCDGFEFTSWLHKTCTPGHENNVCDKVIFNVLAAVAIKKNDLEKAKYWLDKELHLGHE